MVVVDNLLALGRSLVEVLEHMVEHSLVVVLGHIQAVGHTLVLEVVGVAEVEHKQQA